MAMMKHDVTLSAVHSAIRSKSPLSPGCLVSRSSTQTGENILLPPPNTTSSFCPVLPLTWCDHLKLCSSAVPKNIPKAHQLFGNIMTGCRIKAVLGHLDIGHPASRGHMAAQKKVRLSLSGREGVWAVSENLINVPLFRLILSLSVDEFDSGADASE